MAGSRTDLAANRGVDLRSASTRPEAGNKRLNAN
jgi:hypothetical protein